MRRQTSSLIFFAITRLKPACERGAPIEVNSRDRCFDLGNCRSDRLLVLFLVRGYKCLGGVDQSGLKIWMMERRIPDV